MFNRTCVLYVMLVLIISSLSCGVTNIPRGSAGWQPPMKPKTSGLSNEYASLVVKSEPSGCVVYLNGTKNGLSPTRLELLPPGRHTVKLTLAGYKDYVRTVTLREGREKSIMANMKKIEYKNQAATGTRVNKS